MEKIKFAAPCLLGIEGICADELKRYKPKMAEFSLKGTSTLLQKLIYVRDMPREYKFFLRNFLYTLLKIYFRVSAKFIGKIFLPKMMLFPSRDIP